MADELDLDLGEEPEVNKVELRIKDLSGKVKSTAEERDKAFEEKRLAEEARLKAEKEVEFYKGFSTLTSKYSRAGEFQDKIKEKVLSGYDIEDATVSVLNKENAFTTTASAPVKKEMVAGGSANTNIQKEEKSFSDMSRNERRQQLEQIELENGDISRILNGNRLQ